MANLNFVPLVDTIIECRRSVCFELRLFFVYCTIVLRLWFSRVVWRSNFRLTFRPKCHFGNCCSGSIRDQPFRNVKTQSCPFACFSVSMCVRGKRCLNCNRDDKCKSKRTARAEAIHTHTHAEHTQCVNECRAHNSSITQSPSAELQQQPQRTNSSVWNVEESNIRLFAE